MEYSTAFHVRLKWLREKRGLTQKDMANELGMSQQGYSKLELGQREPNLATLCKLRTFFNEPLDFIVGYYIEDIRAENLFQLYVETRDDRVDAERELDEMMEYLEDSKNSSLQEKVDIIKKLKEDVRQSRSKEDKAFELFYNYVITIPGSEGKYSEREFWIQRYETRKIEEENVNSNFYAEYDKL